jgi:gas vesicle protein
MSTINIKQAVGMLLVGAMVGASIALLYAPQSGDRNKKDIKKVASKIVNRLEDIQADVRESLE